MVPAVFSLRSSRTVLKRKVSTSRRSGRTKSRASSGARQASKACSMHPQIRRQLIRPAVAAGRGRRPLRRRSGACAAHACIELVHHAGQILPERLAAGCVRRSPRGIARLRRERAPAQPESTAGMLSRALRNARVSRISAVETRAVAHACSRRGSRRACARVTSLVTNGLPSRSPPIQAPNWKNGLHLEALAGVVLLQGIDSSLSEQRRHGLEQRFVEEVQSPGHFLRHRRLLQPQLAGKPKQFDLVAQLFDQSGAFARVQRGDSRSISPR